MPRRNQTPKHQPYVDKNTCQTKRRFANEKAAQKTADLWELQKGAAFTAYKCDRCQGWHLTSKKSTT